MVGHGRKINAVIDNGKDGERAFCVSGPGSVIMLVLERLAIMEERDEEARRHDLMRSVRSFMSSDGKKHFAWLQNWFWDALDYLEREKGVVVQNIVDQCWTATQFDEDADYQFVAELECVIHDAWHKLEKGVANDNRYV
jgi:hypothetical protein